MTAAFNWDKLDDTKFASEAATLKKLRAGMTAYNALSAEIEREAAALIDAVRSRGGDKGMIAGLLARMDLSSTEGLALMRISEAFHRAAFAGDKDQLIQEQLGQGDWSAFAAKGGALETALASAARAAKSTSGSWLAGLGGNLAIRTGVGSGVGMMAGEFVLGDTIDAALRRAAKDNILCSFDMLGEGARTLVDAARYEQEYASCIDAVGKSKPADGGKGKRHNVSVKLSALDCKYDATKEARAFERLYPRLERLMLKAAAADLEFYIDAEEADRLVLSLKLLDKLEQAAPKGWTGLGLAVQAYQRRGIDICDMLIDFAKQRQRRLCIRLVKGAYWDAEVKRGQILGLQSYPVFTSKSGTDVSYLACAERLLAARPHIYPAFATHNAHTIAAVKRMAAENPGDFEYQRLHGMGADSYAAISNETIRAYAPVGKTEDLLPYLVRRLLENGANSSFVGKLRDASVSSKKLGADPAHMVGVDFAPRIVDPHAIFGGDRKNTTGLDLSARATREAIVKEIAKLDAQPVNAGPLIGGKPGPANAARPIRRPAATGQSVGQIAEASVQAVDAAFRATLGAQPAWNATGGSARAAILDKVADALEAQAPRFMALLAREAGRTLSDAIFEVREAADFCRYYAHLARRDFADRALVGPSGETNTYRLTGRGVFVCISPWNFPLAIFLGQVSAALAAGNAVIAKPAPQTPAVAYEAVKLFIACGLDPNLIALLPGGGEIGEALVSDKRHAGVVFTGSYNTGRRINLALANRPGPLPRFVAETSGLNAIFADSTALPEQLMDDAIVSAFGSAGQRCSSARFLFLPASTAPGIRKRLELAMAQLTIGDPADPATDIGPLIDAAAKGRITDYLAKMRDKGLRVTQTPLPASCNDGHFVAPAIVDITSLDGFDEEVFGPVLHVLTYKDGEAAALAKEFHAKGFALTLGVHTRLKKFEDAIQSACPVGNVYINRSIIGAVVGVQPFGGFGMSGTGPKAGGPMSLHPFANEICVSDNISSKCGDLELFNKAAEA